MKIGTIFLDGDEFDWYFDNGRYYQIEQSTLKETPLTKAYIAQTVGNMWDENCNKDNTLENKDNFETVRFIPIYDGIFVQLYGYGSTKEESIEKVKALYDELLEYNDKIEENIQRNLENQMLRVHRFAILPEDRIISTIDKDEDYYENMEIIFFEDGKEDFRELVINEGIPDDARADEPITGYVEENKIVFTRWGFIKGEFERYLSAINKYEDKIVSHYNLKEEYEVYLGASRYYDILNYDENGNQPEDIIDSDFDYYYPKNKRK